MFVDVQQSFWNQVKTIEWRESLLDHRIYWSAFAHTAAREITILTWERSTSLEPTGFYTQAKKSFRRPCCFQITFFLLNTCFVFWKDCFSLPTLTATKITQLCRAMRYCACSGRVLRISWRNATMSIKEQRSRLLRLSRIESFVFGKQVDEYPALEKQVSSETNDVGGTSSGIAARRNVIE